METIILQGNSSPKAKLILQLAKELNFKTKKLSATEVEEIGIALSIQNGIDTGFLNDDERDSFLSKISTI